VSFKLAAGFVPLYPPLYIEDVLVVAWLTTWQAVPALGSSHPVT
jgi:hypothetical protein